MEDYMTIGEVARIKKVTTKALRHYEKIGELQTCLNRLKLASRGLKDTEKYVACTSLKSVKGN